MVLSQGQFLTRDMQLSEDANQRLIQLEAVNKISTALRAAQTIEEILLLLAEETQNSLDAAAVTIWLCDSEKNELYQAAASGFPNLKTRLKPGEGIAGQVFESGQTYTSPEFKTDARTHTASRSQVPAGLGGAAVPIRAMAETIGVLFASVLLPREFSLDQVRLLTIVAEMAGIAIHRMQLYELTERRLQRLSALQAIHMAITVSLDLPTILNILLAEVLTQLRVDAADILLFDPETKMLEFTAGRGFRGKGIQQVCLRLGEGLAGRAAVEHRTQSVPILSDVSRDATGLPPLADEGFVSYSAIPLMSKGQVRGVLDIFRRTGLQLDQEWLDFCETLAGLAAIAIDNAMQYENMGRSNFELALANDGTIEAWARSLDMRAGEPAGHAQRVAEMTVRLGRAMGLRKAELVQIRRGALLHDIGMMGVPESILLNPGKLSDQEWEIIRKHPVRAYELLSSIEAFKPGLEIPYCHHEKWNGSGYPNGLEGENIPLSARIFALVDAWDALSCDRPHRRAWPEAKIAKHITALSGTHFDPKVVEAFLREIAEE